MNESDIFYDIEIADDRIPSCVICLDHIGKSTLIILPLKNISNCQCKGTYHIKCLNNWFIKKRCNICPICMSTFRNDTYQYNANYIDNNSICNSISNSIDNNKCFICIMTTTISLFLGGLVIYLQQK